MASSGLAILASILGGTAQGLPKGMHEADVLAEQEAKRAEQTRQFDTLRADARSALTTDLSSLGGPASVPTAVAGQYMTGMESRRKESAGRDRLADLAGVLAGQAQTMPPPGVAAENELPTVTDPGMLKLSKMIPGLMPASADAAVLDRLKVREPKPAEPFTLGADQQRYDAGGKLIASGPPKAPKDADTGQRREALIDTVLAEKGYVPGTAAFNEQKLNLIRTFPLAEGGAIYGGASLIPPANGAAPGAGGGGPPPMVKGATKPIEATSAQKIAGVQRVRVAADQIRSALRDPAVRNYIGPYAQYAATVQRGAPYESLGKIPPAVVDLNQNMATIRNYVINLVTGAQMSEPEAKRIMKELPDEGQQAGEFAQRLNTTMRNVDLMERTLRTLVLRGDQNARLMAQELGLEPQGPADPLVGRDALGQQGGGAPPPVVRWGRDAQGNPVRLP